MSELEASTTSADAVLPTSGAVERPVFEMVPVPGVGRLFTGERRVRLGDVDPSGRLRFDALTRYTQDVSNDDTRDAGLVDDLAFVVRSTTVDEIVPGVFGETLTIATFCGRLGKRWAERRLTVSGSEGARYEVATLWVYVDTATGRPRALADDFLHHYGEAAVGQTVKAKQTIPKPQRLGVDPVRRSWPLRAVDFDTLAHMNNAAYWAVVEEDRRHRPPAGPQRITIEYGGGIGPEDLVTIATAAVGAERFVWWEVAGQPVASAALSPLSDRSDENSIDR